MVQEFSRYTSIYICMLQKNMKFIKCLFSAVGSHSNLVVRKWGSEDLCRGSVEMLTFWARTIMQFQVLSACAFTHCSWKLSILNPIFSSSLVSLLHRLYETSLSRVPLHAWFWLITMEMSGSKILWLNWAIQLEVRYFWTPKQNFSGSLVSPPLQSRGTRLWVWGCLESCWISKKITFIVSTAKDNTNKFFNVSKSKWMVLETSACEEINSFDNLEFWLRIWRHWPVALADLWTLKKF